MALVVARGGGGSAVTPGAAPSARSSRPASQPSSQPLAVGGAATGAGDGGGSDDRRWVGRPVVVIGDTLLRQCTEETDGGKTVGLNLRFQFIEQIEGLEECAPHLRSLDLSSNNIRRLEGLSGMGKLRELKVHSCHITRIQGLETLTSLSALHLEGNRISVIEGFRSLHALEYLNLDKNKIQQIGNGLSRLKKLKELHLSRNELEDLDGLAGLSCLETLTARHNRLQHVKQVHLKGLGRLDELNLAGNQLQGLRFLAGPPGHGALLPSLSSLDVSENTLTADSIKGLPDMVQLMELSLAGNHLDVVPAEFVSSCPSLEILDLSRNRFENAADLATLKDLTSLTELVFKDNPLSTEDDAMRRVLASIESLEYVDDQPKPSPPPPAQVDEEPTPEIATFGMTAPRVVGDLALGATSSRPGTAGRPGTASRPGTAQSMKEKGVLDPLMHLQSRMVERRFADEEKVTAWERQTLSSLAAIDTQIEKTLSQAVKEVARMDRCLEKAQEALRKGGAVK